ncbi:MAG: acetyl-CoA carboxylase biotin carboxyl carrier protein subunit [Bacteroidales bacterium]|nr:acetyl-CoA carboxylase biotin carboxyl carrier protein subunit [Bacteroidales bacterium]
MKTYKFNINGKNYEVVVDSIEGSKAAVTVNGKNYEVAIEQGIDAPVAAPVAPVAPVAAAPLQTAAPAQAAPAAAPSGKGTQVLSPLPGVILKVEVTVGQAVKSGQTVAVLEAMKMENSIEAECDGTITAIHVAKGESVLESAPIVTIG